MKNTLSNILDLSRESAKKATSTKESKIDVVSFVSECYKSSVQAKIFHWQILGPGAGHVALDDFRDDMLEHVDKLIETYQGQYENLKNFSSMEFKDITSAEECITYFTEFLSYLDKNREKVFKDSDFLNIIDEMKSTTKTLLYKLKRLS